MMRDRRAKMAGLERAEPSPMDEGGDQFHEDE
jgi:hypothetical protein